jgi:hypothetical protein
MQFLLKYQPSFHRSIWLMSQKGLGYAELALKVNIVDDVHCYDKVF